MNSCTARVEQQAFEITTLRGELETERAARMHAEEELKQNDRTPLDSHVLGFVHTAATDLMGCFEKFRYTEDPDETAYWDLPHPLAPNAEKRKTPDGEGILYNPAWDEDVISATNSEFIDAILALVNQRHSLVLDPVKHNPKVLKDAAQTYFRSLKREYSFRNTDEGRKRHANKNQYDRRLNRRKEKAKNRRKAIPAFRKVVGYAQTVGIEAIVNTDCVSSEHSLGESEACGDGAAVLNVLPVGWMSKQMRDIHEGLGVIARVLPTGRAATKAEPLLTADDDGVDFTPDQRGRFLRLVLLNVARRKGRGRSKYVRRKGPEDSRMRKGVVNKGLVYKESVQEVWAATELTNIEPAPAPARLTIFGAEVPAELLQL
ncbi:hypothetical protein C8Q76DRAFT_297260 [Earliella scabrosa]|nr:hypothetical protein C8Q76DRAFT_297260 [Earliella scabrosa]